jgi:hypothetical protein
MLTLLHGNTLKKSTISSSDRPLCPIMHNTALQARGTVAEGCQLNEVSANPACERVSYCLWYQSDFPVTECCRLAVQTMLVVLDRVCVDALMSCIELSALYEAQLSF